jgi:hypothetical protein
MATEEHGNTKDIAGAALAAKIGAQVMCWQAYAEDDVTVGAALAANYALS